MTETYYLGVGLTDGILRMREIADGQTGTVEQRHDPIPEDLMTELEDFSGNGKGRVTVGGELASSVEFGFKAQSFVSISVTCDSSLSACEAVHDLIQPVVKRLVEQDHKEMSERRDSMLPAGKGLGLKSEHGPGKVAAPAKLNRPLYKR
jgi:hypothetical protein